MENFCNDDIVVIPAESNGEFFALKRLCAPIYDILDRARMIASEMSIDAYVVGGMVRDLKLGVPIRDIDIVVSSRYASFASHLIADMGGQLRKHSDFCTAMATIGDITVDIVQMRREIYRCPGALPTVMPGTLKDDIMRRDFTANSIALGIAGRAEGKLYIVGTAWNDLERGILRIWHSHSFYDDPTRLLRAVKYAGRYNWSLEKKTELAFKEAVKSHILKKLSASRLRHELELICQEFRVDTIFSIIFSYDLDKMLGLPIVDRKLVLKRLKNWSALDWNCKFDRTERFSIVLALICAESSRESICNWARFMGLSKNIVKFISDGEKYLSIIASLSNELESVGELSWILHSWSECDIAVLKCLSENRRIDEFLERYRHHWEDMVPIVDGALLLNMGLTPVTEYKKILKLAWIAQFEGKFNNVEEARCWLNKSI